MTVDLTQENEALLAQAAAHTHRSEFELANEAVQWYLTALTAPDDDHSERIARSRQQIAEGRSIDHEALFAEIFQQLGR